MRLSAATMRAKTARNSPSPAARRCYRPPLRRHGIRQRKTGHKKDGTIEHSGVSLNAPSFKFYQPKTAQKKDLQISLTKDGFAFPNRSQQERRHHLCGHSLCHGEAGKRESRRGRKPCVQRQHRFRTIFNGAEFSMEKLGYGLNTRNEFKVNGVKGQRQL